MCKVPETTAMQMVTSIGDEFHENSPTHRLSTLQDLEAVRPLELDETMGYAVRLAEQHDLSLPLLEASYSSPAPSTAIADGAKRRHMKCPQPPR